MIELVIFDNDGVLVDSERLANTILAELLTEAGLPYSFAGQMRIDEITGCSPYGASTIAGGKGERMPSENELAGARFQGKHVAEITGRLVRR